jgi:hypothetical protein
MAIRRNRLSPCGPKPKRCQSRESRLNRRLGNSLQLLHGQFSLLAVTVVGCHLLFLASTGTLFIRKRSAVNQHRERGGAGLSASRRRWTSTARKVVNLGAHYAMVALLSPHSPQCPDIDTFDAKDVISRSYPDTSPIYFYQRGKPFFECASTSTSPYVCKELRLTCVLCPGLLISLCIRWSMMERYMLPQNTVRRGVIPVILINDNPSCSLSSVQVHDHCSSVSRAHTNTA